MTEKKKNFLIYETNYCPYCVRAKNLLDKLGLDYETINVEDDEERAKMIEKTGGHKTVPQIFMNDEYLGDSEALFVLYKSGKLN